MFIIGNRNFSLLFLLFFVLDCGGDADLGRFRNGGGYSVTQKKRPAKEGVEIDGLGIFREISGVGFKP
jgi:hypothetical protein